jgi:hypothetical protein
VVGERRLPPAGSGIAWGWTVSKLAIQQLAVARGLIVRWQAGHGALVANDCGDEANKGKGDRPREMGEAWKKIISRPAEWQPTMDEWTQRGRTQISKIPRPKYYFAPKLLVHHF